MKKYSIVVLLAFIWSAYYYSLGTSNKLLSPFLTGAIIRLATGILLTVYLASKKKLSLVKVDRKILPLLVSIGIMGYLLDVTAFFGSRYGNSVTGTLLLKTDVVMVGIMSAIFYKEKFTAKQWGLVAVMLVGVVMVVGINPFHMDFAWADLLYVLSAFFVSCNVFLIKRAQKFHVENQIIAFYNNNVTLLLFLASMLFAGDLVGADAGANMGSLVTALIVGSLGQFFVYVVYYKALQRLPVRNVKILLLLIPIITLVYDFIFQGVIPTPQKLIGTAIVLISATLILKCSQDPAPAAK